jgi:hypothetical protein
MQQRLLSSIERSQLASMVQMSVQSNREASLMRHSMMREARIAASMPTPKSAVKSYQGRAGSVVGAPAATPARVPATPARSVVSVRSGGTLASSVGAALAEKRKLQEIARAQSRAAMTPMPRQESDVSNIDVIMGLGAHPADPLIPMPPPGAPPPKQ